MTRLDDRPVSKQTLHEVIGECNQSVIRKFSKGMKEVREVKGTIVSKDELDWHAVRLTCEDSRLSLQRMGEPFLILDLSKTDPCDIDQDTFNFMLDVAAAMLNIEDTYPSGKSTKSMKWEIMQSDGFKLGRAILRSRV